ncbi:cellulase [Stenotrophobium rhamnosiphilum]|uniref:Glucanase n=2 Tax=Stenotrophobium rhamnosiphilum TaxID=2029166 RepID=A0A2T5MEJ0_9GAMM|nr:cellulase [Stenotrophobium rhamnosiphilum]
MIAAFLLGISQAHAAANCDWPQWTAFKTQLISADGRVIDASTPQQHTVSEGQAYALFFALVANDRPAFEKLLQWTENNLAQGDLTAYLPAWQWGHRDDGSWGVIDKNPASDADVWIAYALGEAGRLWNERRYTVLSNIIANRILREETADIPSLGLTLLPGSVGFTQGKNRWRLNPSYAPIQALRRLAANDPDSSWSAVVASSQKLITDSAPKGFSPDWVLFQTGKGFLPDVETQADGSYNSIRVYLWAGLMDRNDPARAEIMNALRPMAAYVAAHGVVPEHVDTRNGVMKGDGPSGFVAAMIPFIDAAGDAQTAQKLRQQLSDHPVPTNIYYGQALALFAQGGTDGSYRFNRDGSLVPRWTQSCVSPQKR